jgi:hypothetical protein
MHRVILAFALALAATIAIACSDDSGGGGGGTDTDTDTDSDSDTDSDTDTDSDSDTDSDTDTDPDTDTDTDTDPETWPNADSPRGTNISSINDWMTQWAFVDAFKMARAWIPQLVDDWIWDTGEPLDLTPEGWIASLADNQAAGTLILIGEGGHYPAGTYTVLYEGEGELEFRWDAEVTDSSPGQYILDVTPFEGIYIKQVATNPDDPLRDIRVIMPGFEDVYEEEPFHPLFLERLERFKVLRYMDLQETNNSPLASWDDRPLVSDANQSSDRGVALEYLIELANTLNADPWFCLPHLADDDFVEQFAQMVFDDLDPDLTVYVEHSNEVWNGIFSQAGYAQAQGLALGLSTNAYEAQLRYHSQRSVEIFAIFEQVFGGTERLVRVLASHSANPWSGETIMDFEEAYASADALGVAPYFGYSLGDPDTQDEVVTWTVDEVLAACEDEIAQSIADCASNEAAAAERGLVLTAYEGGQHLVGHGGAENNDDLTALFQATNRDPGMGLLYLDYLAGWKDSGGQMFANFSYVGAWSMWGSWGVLEYQDQPQDEAPKYDALMQFIDAEPQWW